MKIDNDILANILSEFQRKDIDKHKKAIFIREAMKETGLSNRRFAKEFNIPLTTLKDWLVYTKITESEHNGLKAQGLKETQIFRTLRNTKQESLPKTFQERINEQAEFNDLDNVLRDCINAIRIFVRNPKKSRETFDLIIELQNMISTIRERIR